MVAKKAIEYLRKDTARLTAHIPILIRQFSADATGEPITVDDVLTAANAEIVDHNASLQGAMKRRHLYKLEHSRNDITALLTRLGFTIKNDIIDPMRRASR